jgi:hypothetical protein
VNDIAKGILAGGWSLVAGWILPTAVNTLVFGFLVLPSLRGVPVIGSLGQAKAPSQTFAVLATAVVAGLVFSALQTPLYRLLEGYVLWPPAIAAKRRDHFVRIKGLMQRRLDAIYFRNLDNPTPEDKQQLAELEADPKVSRFLNRRKSLTAVQQSLLAERLRYPVADEQVAPTRLGNAIRRLEEYAYDRYRLDSQALWYQLTAAAPKPLRQQINSARAGVDFFVCLLYGQLLVAMASLASLSAPHPHDVTLVVTAAVLIILAPVWYRLAWTTTDDWALAVRALVDLGRKPLAESLGLRLPGELHRERDMWTRYSQMVLWPYDADRAACLDEFRVATLRQLYSPEMSLNAERFSALMGKKINEGYSGMLIYRKFLNNGAPTRRATCFPKGLGYHTQAIRNRPPDMYQTTGSPRLG